MHKHMLRALLLLGGVALAYIFWRFRIHSFIFAWFWSMREIALVMGQTFFFRSIMRPPWNLFTKVCIAIAFGHGVEGRYRHWVLDMFWNFNEFVMIVWHGLPRMWRSAAFLGFGAGLALIVWTRWEVVLFIPLAASLFRRVDYWLGDRFFDRWFGWLRLKFRFHRFIHTNKRVWNWKGTRLVRHWYAVALQAAETAREKRQAKRAARRNEDDKN